MFASHPFCLNRENRCPARHLSESVRTFRLTMLSATVKIIRASPGADAVQMFLSEATQRIGDQAGRPMVRIWSARVCPNSG